MSVGKKIRELREERGWSQDEFAYHAGIDGRQISRYENDRVTPSTEVIIKMAQAFAVSTDYLLIDDAPRIAVRAQDAEVLELLKEVQNLSDEDRQVVRKIIDAFVTKKRLKELAVG